MITRSQIEDAYRAACGAEIEALKPGNVHRFANGHRMTIHDFLESARVTAPIVADPSLRPGQRILQAVRATRETVHTNTNLGILLLCVPLACAGEADSHNLRDAVRKILAALDMKDTRTIYEAIRLASPGGLGSADEHDVREEPQAGILEAMALAADRDLIARQYTNGFSDVFETGLPALEAAREAGETGMWPTIYAYLAFLTRFEDSHILRKQGQGVAEQVKDEASAVLAAINREANRDLRLRTLLAFDASLKDQDVNPGTSADLTVATCFADQLITMTSNEG